MKDLQKVFLNMDADEEDWEKEWWGWDVSWEDFPEIQQRRFKKLQEYSKFKKWSKCWCWMVKKIKH